MEMFVYHNNYFAFTYEEIPNWIIYSHEFQPIINIGYLSLSGAFLITPSTAEQQDIMH